MKYMKQFGIILGVTCAGEIIKYFVPLPVPGSIYGLLLMLIFLMSGIIKLEQVKETAEFLIEIMPFNVHSGRSGIVKFLGTTAKNCSAGFCHNTCVYFCGYGCYRKGYG